MARYDPFGIGNLLGSEPPRRRTLTHAQKVWCWENKPHTCNICGKRVSKFSEAEFDHTRAYSKGGATNLSSVRITHRLCNRIKGTKPLSETKKFLGVKPKKRASKRKLKRSTDPFALPAFSLRI